MQILSNMLLVQTANLDDDPTCQEDMDAKILKPVYC